LRQKISRVSVEIENLQTFCTMKINPAELEPVIHMTELAPRLYRLFTEAYGSGAEVQEHRDRSFYITPIVFGGDSLVLAGFATLDRDQSWFIIWYRMPDKSRETFSPNPIVKVYSGGFPRNEYSEEKGTLYRDCAHMDFGHFNDQLDLTCPIFVVVSHVVLLTANALLKGVARERFWEIERFPWRERFTGLKPPVITG